MYVIGLDYGTDSVRAIIVNAMNGEELATSVYEYPRWKAGLYCNAQISQFRQHPLDYIEGMEKTIRACIAKVDKNIIDKIISISITTTGSTPVAIDHAGTPLALRDDFKDNPNAMFFLWKDHTALQEAEEINNIAAGWETDYLKYAGGLYSPEWFWAKLLYALRHDEKVRQHCFTWVEHCDWMPFLLTGGKDAFQLKRNVCAAGHKALWAAEHKGYPSPFFLRTVDPLLESYGYIDPTVHTADKAAGHISPEWAERLGLPGTVLIGIGAIDAHVGAIGAQIEPGYLTRIIGTSTCDMLVVPKENFENKFIKGICGQVDGSIIPGMIGLEAGQAAFGDVYSWFRQLLLWPLKNMSVAQNNISLKTIEAIHDNILTALEESAQQLEWDEESPLAIDWLNGRRTPDVNLLVKGAITQLSLGSDAPRVYASLVEATCFGAKEIVERIREEGIEVKGIIGVGGISRKSPFVMQTMADVLGMDIKVSRTSQICAMGAAMLAATVAGLHVNVLAAMKAMGSGFDIHYTPNKERALMLEGRYQKYKAVCGLSEQLT